MDLQEEIDSATGNTFDKSVIGEVGCVHSMDAGPVREGFGRNHITVDTVMSI
jgi:hypothetical protein